VGMIECSLKYGIVTLIRGSEVVFFEMILQYLSSPVGVFPAMIGKS